MLGRVERLLLMTLSQLASDPDVVAAKIAAGECSPHYFCQVLGQVPLQERDSWWNRVLTLDELPDDSNELARGCVPYIPCSLDVLSRVVEHAPVTARDVFVDVGCGPGRAASFVRVLTRARVMGIDIQPHLVNLARACAARLNLSDVAFVTADACERFFAGSVYFLYCPFGADRVRRFLDGLRPLVSQRRVVIACLDVDLPACDWLTQSRQWPDLRLYQSVIARP